MESIDKKPTDLDIKQWSEGNEHLQKLLKSARENNVPSMFCCAGHGKNQPAYITLQMNKETMEKIYSIMNSIADKENIAFRFAEKEFGTTPSFTIYMLNPKEKNNIMDIISQAMDKEVSLEKLPHNYRKLIQINQILTENDIGFDFEYKIGKSSNELLLENLRFGNSEWIEGSDFKQMGLKLRKDMFNNTQFYKNGISKGAKEQSFLNNIVQNLSRIYSMDLETEHEEKISFNQKVLQKISSNRILRRIPFVDRVLQKQLKALPEGNGEKTTSKRETLMSELSNDGEYLNLSEKREIKEHRKIYYEVGDKDYEIPMFEKYIEYIEENGETIKLKKKGNGKYVIAFDEMSSEEKYSVLKEVLDKALTYVAVLTNLVYEDEPNIGLKTQKTQELQSLCRTSEITDYISKKLYSESKIDEANSKLDKKIQEVLEFYQRLGKNEKGIEI